MMQLQALKGSVTAVSRAPHHGFSKQPSERITIIEGIGVQDDAHAGETVRHRSRVRIDPTQPNLRQVHLISAELIEDLNTKGFDLTPGALGENIMTRGIDLIALGRGSLLHVGSTVVLEVTGLRNPCHQIEAFRHGLLQMVVEQTPHGPIRKAGIMTIVRAGGLVMTGDAIGVELAAGVHIPLDRV